MAIAAALQGWHGGGGLLVLDEPTAVLPHDEVERLFAVVREVRKAGTAILYVSHRMDEIFELADRVTILRGGRLVGTHDIATPGPARARGPDGRRGRRPRLPCAGRGEAATRRWCSRCAMSPASGCAASTSTSTEGEILGLAGLAGAGVLELPYVIAGHAPRGDKVTGQAAPAPGLRRVARRAPS